MRAVVDGIEIEGTPSEIAEFLKNFGNSANAPSAKADPNKSMEQIDDDGESITIQFAYRTLKRIPLSQSQKGLLLFLKRRHPGWVLASEIHKEFEWDGTQFGGVLGGLGRRLTATKGYKESYHLWDWRRDDDEGEYAYRLPEAVVTALERIE